MPNDLEILRELIYNHKKEDTLRKIANWLKRYEGDDGLIAGQYIQGHIGICVIGYDHYRAGITCTLLGPRLRDRAADPKGTRYLDIEWCRTTPKGYWGFDPNTFDTVPGSFDLWGMGGKAAEEIRKRFGFIRPQLSPWQSVQHSCPYPYKWLGEMWRHDGVARR